MNKIEELKEEAYKIAKGQVSEFVTLREKIEAMKAYALLVTAGSENRKENA